MNQWIDTQKKTVKDNYKKNGGIMLVLPKLKL